MYSARQQLGTPGSLLVCQLPQAFRRLPRPSISQRQDIPHVPLVDWPSKSRTQLKLANQPRQNECRNKRLTQVSQPAATESESRKVIYLTISHVLTATSTPTRIPKRNPGQCKREQSSSHRILSEFNLPTFVSSRPNHLSQKIEAIKLRSPLQLTTLLKNLYCQLSFRLDSPTSKRNSPKHRLSWCSFQMPTTKQPNCQKSIPQS